jgi:hypothetical protein
MRLTIRCVLASMRAVEQGLEEILNVMRNNTEYTEYYAAMHDIVKSIRSTRNRLSMALIYLNGSGFSNCEFASAVEQFKLHVEQFKLHV